MAGHGYDANLRSDCFLCPKLAAVTLGRTCRSKGGESRPDGDPMPKASWPTLRLKHSVTLDAQELAGKLMHVLYAARVVRKG
jgi:hypothetical protein